MVKVEFLGPLNREPMRVEASSLQDIAKILQNIDDLNLWLDRCAVAVNNEITTDLSRSLKSGDTISILPPVCGG